MAFNLEATVRQAESGVVSPKWERFTLSNSRVLTGSITLFIVDILFAWIPAYLFFSRTVILPVGLDFGETGDTIVGLIEILGSAAFAIWIFSYGVRTLAEFGKQDVNFLILTPEGFAEKRGKKVQGAAFVDVVNVGARDRYGNFRVRLRSGGSLALNPRRYVQAQDLQALILGYARAAREQPRGGEPAWS